MMAVQEFVNLVPYREELKWQLPKQFLAKGGNCKDYAITKYAIGIESGLIEDGYIILVIDVSRNLSHAVLYADGLVYDNQIKEPYKMDEIPYVIVGKLKMR